MRAIIIASVACLLACGSNPAGGNTGGGTASTGGGTASTGGGAASTGGGTASTGGGTASTGGGTASTGGGTASTGGGTASTGGGTASTGGGTASTGGGTASTGGGTASTGGGTASTGGGQGATDGGSIPRTPFGMPCTGATIDTASVLAHFPPASTTTSFGTVWADARQRSCQDQTGCLGWQPASSVDLYRIVWNGAGFDFTNPTTLTVPASGTITCTVPGPSCTLTIAPMTSNVYPPEQGRPLGITPRVNGSQVQVGSWSFDPAGNYLQYTSSVVATTCLWGSMSGRVYGANQTYVETELLVWGSF